VLTQATYISAAPLIVLLFDRPVNTAGIDGTQIRVDDQPNGHWYLATGGVFVLSPNTIQLYLVLGGSVSGSATLLSAAAGNGIVAVNDGGAWLGVKNLVLPFG
jgi:hypothetical protein